MVLIVLSELPKWLEQDGAKLFFFACVIIAAIGMLKWVSTKNESSNPLPPPPPAEEPEQVAEAESSPEEDVAGEEDGDEEESDWLPPMRSVDFTLRFMRFKVFEFEDGPENPECFCEELEVELNYKNGIMPWGETWVATPLGLEAKLGDKAWNFFYAKQIFIVSHYDPVEIHTTVLRHIKRELESIPEESAADEMKDAQGAG